MTDVPSAHPYIGVNYSDFNETLMGGNNQLTFHAASGNCTIIFEKEGKFAKVGDVIGNGIPNMRSLREKIGDSC